ncbi:MAG: hypothetical protein ACMXYF_03000 [Candidatus Woesearchaeota archaeon]
MKRTLVAYSLSGRKNALEITRKIYGYTDSSNHGKYIYKRKGILSDIPFEKIARGTFFIEPKYKKEVIAKFKELGLQMKIFDITINN